MPEDYEVGFGKPPRASQFEKGRSGNPKGRPKGSTNIATLFNQINRQMIQVKENGKTKTMTRVEAVLHQMTNRALSGDPRTMREFIQLSRLFEEAENGQSGAAEPSERDAAVMASLAKRMKRVSAQPEETKQRQAGAETEPAESYSDEEETD